MDLASLAAPQSRTCTRAAPERAQAAPVMSAGRGGGGHDDPAWRVRWVARGPERGEALVSISTDGRVTQWATSKARSTLP